MTSANRIVILLSALWAVLMGVSFVHPWLADPTGDGFVRGLNLIVYFLGWQAAALPFAIAILVLRVTRSGEITGWARSLGFAPLTAMALEVVAFQTLIVFH